MLLTVPVVHYLAVLHPEPRIYAREKKIRWENRLKPTPYLCFSELTHLVTTARIHVFSSASPPSAFVGCWKATFRPSTSGCCLLYSLDRDFQSRLFDAGGGPSEARSLSVLTLNVILFGAKGGVAGAEAGEDPLRLLRFSRYC